MITRYFAILSLLTTNIPNAIAQVVPTLDQYLSGSPGNENRCVIDFNTIENWVSLGNDNDLKLSNDGRYAAYTIRNGHYDNKMLVVQSTESSWKRIYVGANAGHFTIDNKLYLFQTHDSLCILNLENENKTRWIEKVKAIQVSTQTTWLTYQLASEKHMLGLMNLKTGSEELFYGVINYSFDPSGNWLILEKGEVETELVLYNLITNEEQRFIDGKACSINSKGTRMIYTSGKDGILTLSMANLTNGHSKIIWIPDGLRLSTFSMDSEGDQVVFSVMDESSGTTELSIWYFHKDMEKAIKKIGKGSSGIKKDLSIFGAPAFSIDGKYILFNLIPPLLSRQAPDLASVDIWNYKDTVLQSTQLLASENPGNYWLSEKKYPAVLNISNGQIIQLGDNHIRVAWPALNDVALIKRHIGTDREWENPYCDSTWIISLKDGSRSFIKKTNSQFVISPSGEHLIYFDEEEGHYLSFHISTKRIINISVQAQVYLGSENEFDPPPRKNVSQNGIAGWMNNGNEIIVYDTYDLWKLDITGKTQPINLTNGFGRRNKIVFRLTAGTGFSGILKDGLLNFRNNSTLVLTAFNTTNMNNGFYQINLGKRADPDLLSMGPYIDDFTPQFIIPHDAVGVPISMPPLKAGKSNVWIVKRQSTRQPPNYYISKDLKTFTQLTSLEPHKNFNWYQTELLRFRQLDGTYSQGVLFKPEDFSPEKKYPVIINYYFQQSQRLNEYNVPGYISLANLNIPWFVSRGYLVFLPDIYFKDGRPRAASAYNTVESAGRYLNKLKFVEKDKIGICGHSRAGGYTNYIITHSKLFAAAFEGAGVSDWISSQLQLIFANGNIRMSAGQQEPGIWDRKEVFIENPIMNVDRITTPLLIFHNKLDPAVPWEQAVELYTAMRRLNKKVWILQYDGEGHSVSKKKNKKDLTVRVTQFFDYYLKSSLPPKWMTEGVPAADKGYNSGLELDTSGRLP